MNGTCSLCRKKGRLLDSHFMPKSIYRVISQGFPSDGKNMVWVSGRDKSAAYTSKQAKKHLLCASCESKLSKFGEDAVLPLIARRNGFKLATKITKFKKFANYNDETWFLPPNVKTASHFMYFAVSIAWRMSVTEWSHYGMPKTSGIIRHNYMNYFSEFLLNGTAKDSSLDLFLAVYVDNQDVTYPVMAFPTVSSHDGYQHVVFHIPGLRFSLVVGNLSDSGVKEIYSSSDSNVLFISRSLKSTPDFQKLVHFLQKEASAKGRLAVERKNV
ncbi:hypothetical protein QFY08_000001 [Vibrio alginolyticus]|nr:hypothetical protein [Vibrio alginolyticus]